LEATSAAELSGIFTQRSARKKVHNERSSRNSQNAKTEAVVTPATPACVTSVELRTLRALRQVETPLYAKKALVKISSDAS